MPMSFCTTAAVNDCISWLFSTHRIEAQANSIAASFQNRDLAMTRSFGNHLADSVL